MDYILDALNPWWKNHAWKPQEPYRRREFDQMISLLNYTKNPKPSALILVGPRRVGKTTLMRQLVPYFLTKIPPQNILYYSFERADPEIQHNSDALTNLVSLWGNQDYDSAKPRLLLLDEIQNVTQWGSRMKSILEIPFTMPLLVVMSGSSSFNLLGQSLESLFGLHRKIFIPPFSLGDFWLMNYDKDRTWIKKIEDLREGWFSYTKHHPLFITHTEQKHSDSWSKARKLQIAWLKKGGFPEFWKDLPAQAAAELFDFYVRRVAQDDIMQIKRIANPTEIARFLKYCYFHPGAEMNITVASQELGIPRSTLDVMLDLLNTAGYIRVVPRYTGTAGGLRQRNVKVYPIDHILIPHALRISHDAPTGMAMETMVLNTFARIQQAEISFYRKKTGKETSEIDFVISLGNRIIAVEVKKNCTKKDIENFRKNAMKLLPQATNRLLICWNTDRSGLIQDWVSLDDSSYIQVLPLWQIALGFPILI